MEGEAITQFEGQLDAGVADANNRDRRLRDVRGNLTQASVERDRRRLAVD